MKNPFFLKAVKIALSCCLISFVSTVWADETDNSAAQDLSTDQMQPMNPTPEANGDTNNQNNSAVIPATPNPNPAATPNDDDAHEDTANSGDDDY